MLNKNTDNWWTLPPIWYLVKEIDKREISMCIINDIWYTTLIEKINEKWKILLINNIFISNDGPWLKFLKGENILRL